MENRRCLEKYRIKSSLIPFVDYVRYFSYSSFYLVFGVGILELVARFKDIISQTPNENTDSIKITTFQNFFYKNSDRLENFILKISSHIAKNINNSKQAFQLLNYHFNPQFLNDFETDFRELLYSLLTSEDAKLSELLRSGIDPIDQMPEILTKLSNEFGLSITFCKIGSGTMKFNPKHFDQCPKFFLLYNKTDYSIGYNESMDKLDKSYTLEGINIKDLIKTSKERIIEILENTVEVLIKTLKKREIIDEDVIRLLKDLKINTKSSAVRDYLNFAISDKNIACSKCGKRYSSNEYIKTNCSRGCNVCINCLKIDIKKCPKCGESYKKNALDEIKRKITAQDLKN